MKLANAENPNFNVFYGGAVVMALFNLWALKSAVFGLILGVFWLGMSGFVLGKRYFPNFVPFYRLSCGTFVVFCAAVIFNSFLFYFINLNLVFVAAEFAAMSLFILLIGSAIQLPGIGSLSAAFKRVNLKNVNLWRLVFYAALVAAGFFMLFHHQSSDAIVSPWDALPKIFFVIYFMAAAVLVSLLLAGKNKVETEVAKSESAVEEEIKFAAVSVFYFLTLSIAVIVYKIGFGFDAFIHRAAEIKLSELGYILPKPLYYAGQYALVVFAHKIFVLPIGLADKLFVPLLAAFYLPKTIYYSLWKYCPARKFLFTTTVLLLVLLTPLFFYSVPQALANLLLVILVFLIFGEIIGMKWQLLILATIFLIHPLSAIAGLIIFGYKLFTTREGHFDTPKYQSALKAPLVVLGSVLAPLFFMAGSIISGNWQIAFAADNLNYLWKLFADSFKYLRFNSVYHLIYLFRFNFILIVAGLWLAGLVWLKRTKAALVKQQLSILAIMLVNLVLLGFIKFDGVIGYEQGEFVKRFGQIILLGLSPVLALGIYGALEKISILNKAKLIMIIMMPAFLTIALYLSYPHSDAFVKARGHSTGAADILAVRWINENGGDEEYVVLANQATAAAALKEFGFKRYFNSRLTTHDLQLFYYPIPTASPLYEIYLRMVYDGPSLEYIEEARELTGAQRVYFVINDYWLDAKKRVEQAREIADEEKEFAGKVWVFRFNLQNY